MFVGQESVLLLAEKPTLAITTHKRRVAAAAGVTTLLTAGLALLIWVPVGAIVMVRRKLAARRWAKLARGSDAESEIRKLVYSQQWVRDDPIIQLPPGTAQEKQFSIAGGITQTHMQELAKSLNIPAGELSTALSSKIGFEVNVKVEASQTETLRLQNDSPEKYRLYARWSVVHRLDVYRFPLSSDAPRELIDQLLADQSDVGSQAPFLTVETVERNTTNFTSIDLERPSQTPVAT